MKRKKEKMGLLQKSLAVFVSFVALFLLFGSNRARAAADTDVYIDPATYSANVNDTFSLDAAINPNSNAVSAVELHIVFDQAKVRLDSIDVNTTDFPDILTASSINNTNGTASVTIGSGRSDWVTTTVTMATLNFTALSSGSASVNLTGTLVAAQNETEDVVNSITGGTVTVDGSASTPAFRFLSLETGDHFYTTDVSERNWLVSNFSWLWEGEGTAFNIFSSQADNASPVYRFLNLQNGQHFYTNDANERDWLVNNFSWLWEGEGTAFYAYASSQPNSTPVYRFLNLQNGQHFFTTDANERDWLVNNFSWLWEGEGTAFYVPTN